MSSAVLLDFYGTLGESQWAPGWLDALVAERGLKLDPDVNRRWRSESWDGLEHVEHSIDEAAYGRWQQARLRSMFEELGALGTDLDDLVATVEQRQRSLTMRAFPETVEVLAELRRRGLRLAVCSNWDWDLDRHLDGLGLSDLVDARVSSAWVGARKPHRRIFEATLAELGVEAADAVFVGDNWQADVEGPRALGMRAVHVWRHDDTPSWLPAPPAVPDGVVRLNDLRGLLDVI